MYEIECPVCKTKFEVLELESGSCPNCGNEYYWDEQCTEDYSDCWSLIIWERYE